MAGISTTQAILGGLRGFADKLRSNKTYDQYFPQKRPVNAQDAYFNTATGVGTGRDKAAYGAWTYGPDLADIELEDLYANNDLAATIVEKIVEDALRDGFSIQREGSTPEADAELTKQILARFVELQGGEYRFLRGAVWGRLFGGGGLILGLRGAGALARPLSKDKVKRVEFIKDFDKQQIQPWTWDAAGMPETYLYTPVVYGWTTDIAQPVEVHRDRIIFFPGARTTTSKRRERQGWDLSVLQRVKAALLSFDGMWANVDAMFQDASQAVFHLQGLIQTLGENDGKDDVSIRLRIMDTFRSAARAIVLDAGDETGAGKEDFKVVDRASLGGLDKVMQNYMIRLATAARMPLTVLLGMAPAGMDATGESDMILYYNTVDIYRKQVLQERLLLLIKLIYTELENSTPEAQLNDAMPLVAEEEPEEVEDLGEWTIVWPELSRPKPLDVATAENMRITSALAMVTAQAWTPEEVALNMDIIAPTMGARIDLAPRREALKAAHEEVKNRTVGQGQLEAQSEVETNSQIKVAKAKPPAGKMSERKTPSKAAKRQV
jgi:phage-related protein (TIGR01555 family)